MSPRQATSVLVYVGCDLVGDGMMKLPFVRALRAAFPGARITWLTGRGTSVYASSLAPLVVGLLDEVVAEDVGDFAARQRLAGQRFEIIIDTQRGLPTTLKLRSIPHQRFISATLGYLLSSEHPRHRFRKIPSLASQLLELAALAAGRTVDPSLIGRPDLPAEIEAEAARLLPQGATYVGLAPGAGGRQKCWPLENYLDVGRRLLAAGYIPAVLLGPSEAGWGSAVADALPRARLPLQDAVALSPLLTVALARRMSAAVANDSGAGHMLAAADIPMISLFGPSSPAKFAPVASRLVVMRAQDFGAANMAAIPVDAVWNNVVALLRVPPC